MDISKVTVIVRLNLFVMTSLAYWDIDIDLSNATILLTTPRQLLSTNLAISDCPRTCFTGLGRVLPITATIADAHDDNQKQQAGVARDNPRWVVRTCTQGPSRGRCTIRVTTTHSCFDKYQSRLHRPVMVHRTGSKPHGRLFQTGSDFMHFGRTIVSRQSNSG